MHSLNKSTALIEREEGRSFAPLLAALRLHGITDSMCALCVALRVGWFSLQFAAQY